MLKSFGLQVRKTEMNHAQFMAHWHNVHAPMSRGIAGVRGYVLNEIVAVERDSHIAPLNIGMRVDGIAQLWFDSREAMMALTQTPEVKRWFSDGPNYIGARTGFATAEHVLRKNDAAAFKLIYFSSRKRDVVVEDFRRRWREDYAPAVLQVEGVQGYIQSEVTAASPATNMPTIPIDEVDGIGEVWMQDRAAATRVLEAVSIATRSSSAALFDKTAVLIAQETVIIAPPR